MHLPPLALYVHIPWCVQKCPYCDFNSHALKPGEPALDQAAYVAALLADLDQDLGWLDARGARRDRRLRSIFIGGGTPSLFDGPRIDALLQGVRARLPWTDDIEVTIEANPGAAEAHRFAAYRAAGVNRLSLGVQSFAADKLRALGRIHGPEEAVAAVSMARAAGFEHLNLDLMFGLPGQTPGGALADLERAIGLGPSHLSWYQLTIEANTAFARHPPPVPDEDSVWEIQQAGMARLSSAGYRQYEVSAYAQAGQESRHNRNYWEFGDYLGIGAGAHGKVSLVDGSVLRRWKPRHPRDYLCSAGRPEGVAGQQALGKRDLSFEFMLNALRLVDGVDPELFPARTGLDLEVVRMPLERARRRGLLEAEGLRPTELGRRFLNDLVNMFADS